MEIYGRVRTREMFVPLTHAPGKAQANFGEAWVSVAGVECKVHFSPSLPWSGFPPPQWSSFTLPSFTPALTFSSVSSMMRLSNS